VTRLDLRRQRLAPARFAMVNTTRGLVPAMA